MATLKTMTVLTTMMPSEVTKRWVQEELSADDWLVTVLARHVHEIADTSSLCELPLSVHLALHGFARRCLKTLPQENLDELA